MALDATGQGEWGGGIYRGRKAPANTVYDAENALVDDQANVFRRGGSAFRSTADAGATLLGLLAASTAAGVREIAWGAGTALYVLSDAQAPVTVAASASDEDGKNVRPFARGAQIGPFLLIPKVAGSDQVNVYAGSRKAAYGTGTIDVENGSRTVTGHSTVWAANADAGMMLFVDGPSGTGSGGIAGFGAPVVASIESNTSLTLRDPYAGPTETGKTYALRPRFPLLDGLADALPMLPAAAERFVASAGQRALVAAGNRVLFNEDFPAILQVHDGALRLNNQAFHELPQDAVISGADSIEDTAMVFTNTGMWRITNLAFDAIDDAGNVQRQVEQVSKDLILWGDPGVTAYGGQLVVPTLEDVYVMGVDGPHSRASDAIRPLYRSYVAAGYQPGTAAVFAGHYFLPVVDGTTLVDVLVCRLDLEGSPWTRWSGHAAGRAFAQRVGEAVKTPKLLAIAAQRVTDLTGCLAPSIARDADGSGFDCTVITRDFPTSGTNHPGTVAKARLRYELVGGDDFARADGDAGANWSNSPFSRGSSPLQIVGGRAAGAADGSDTESWWVPDTMTGDMRVECEVSARPGGNAAAVYSSLGLVDSPHALAGAFPNGYEARVLYEAAADRVAIYRTDVSSPTVIAGPVALGSRVAAGDRFALTLDTSGALSVLINDVERLTGTDTTYFHAGESAFATMGIFDVTAPSRSAIRHDNFQTPAVALAYSSDQDGGVFTTLAGSMLERAGTAGGGVSNGSLYSSWPVGKMRERIRFRITVPGAVGSFTLRTLELLTRQGRLR